MTERHRQAAKAEGQDFVWPPPVSADDIVWLEPTSTPPPLDGEGNPPDSPATLEPSALPLSRFLSPDVRFEWHDAVAIVQQLAEQITRGLRGEPAGSIPEIHKIRIEASGQLRVRLDPVGRESLSRGLGYLLHRLLTDRDGPVALRLIVSRVVSDLPTIHSVEELTHELSRWERPYRIQKLVQLYERAKDAPDISPFVLAITEPVVAAVPPAVGVETVVEPAEATRAHGALIWALLSSHPVAALSAALAVCVVLVAAASLTLSSRPEIAVPAPPAISETPQAANQDTASPRVAERVPVRPNDQKRARAAATSVRSPSAPKSTATPSRAPTPTRPRLLSDAAVSRFIAQPIAPLLAPPVTIMLEAQRVEVGLPAVPPIAPAVTISLAAGLASVGPTLTRKPLEPDIPDRLYTSGDSEVIAPVLVKPYLPELRDPGTEERLGVLDVVVTSTGTVESVRLRSPVNRYRERWWLFVAKNFQFRPATLEGRPVRFLKRIVITDIRLSEPQ